jgi:ketosteroid isomerase-like protein
MDILGAEPMTNEQIARAMYEAFREDRRADAEALMAPDFTFTSPYDDAIGRDEFFRRCWPNNKRFSNFEIERVTADAEGAFITYLVTTKEGAQFRNTEYLTVTNRKLAKVDVYFGASYRDGKFVAKKPD